MIRERDLGKDEKGEKLIVKEKIVVTWNDETGELKKLSPFLGIDYDLVEFDAQFDGINVLCTSEVNMSDEKIIENYPSFQKLKIALG